MAITDEVFEFPSGDPENPRNWPSWKKWMVVLAIIPTDFSVSWGASCFSPVQKKFQEDMHVSSEAAVLGLSVYVCGLAVGPMLMAPLSEYFGRRWIYLIGYGCATLFMMAAALVPNYGGFLPIRFITAVFASITIANLGGTIADLWHHSRTGYAMSIFLWAATAGSPSGVFLASFIGQYRPWRDVFWAMFGIFGGFWLIMFVFVRETRHSTLLRRRAAKKLKESGGKNADDPEFDVLKQHRSVKTLFRVALTRPFRFIFTEAIVIFGALYNGYLYGLSFLFNGAFSLVFGPEGHGFDTLQVGLSFLGISTGITLGIFSNIWQEKYYRRKVKESGGANIPEARVQVAMIAAITFPISLFWFAWTTYKSVHWIVPILASGLWGWSFYTLILMSYMVVEDSYGQFAASALAGLGLVRNLAGGGFPLFGRQLFTNLGYQWAASLLAFLAVLLVPIPFVLSKYGRALRQRSPYARMHMTEQSPLHEDNEGTPSSDEQKAS